MSDTPARSDGPLRAIKVLDFSGFLAGPFCTQILADLGAEVIKVESPHGDSSRGIPPHFIGEDSLYYLSANRNKKSVVIDLKNPIGRELALDLIAQVDVVVENFGPGVANRLGIDAEKICAANTKLVWSTIRGFGRTGHRTDLPAYDLIVQALSGVMTITGEPGSSPVRLGIPAGDLVAGMYSCIGILAALAEPERGRGRLLDVAMFDSLLSMISYLGAYSLFTGVAPGPQGSAHDSIPTYRCFDAGDGRRVAVTANTERMWRGLCAVVEREDLVADPRFATATARLENKHALWPTLEEAFATRDGADWVERCKAHGVPAALVTDAGTALDEARRDTRSMILQLQSASGQTVEVLGNPVKYEGDAPPAPRYPPSLGEHTREVLVEGFGLSPTDVDRLEHDGAIRIPR